MNQLNSYLKDSYLKEFLDYFLIFLRILIDFYSEISDSAFFNAFLFNK